ncbi:NADH dehydrogenase [ubiquinone] 1 alpha subcomplex subunit 2 isoform X2 [Notamacropus eugenii]|uniref:NADH dehydrogenase [ubiquinone] 1 alpha subcomplex subunit 2 isoform X2 n=1 Tax=Notamacropus eugenii TaxID=9315 RepID=UPI003B66F6E7
MAAAAARGVGFKVGKNLRELRIHLCQRSASSQGVRDFIEKHYVELKKANPDFPILIRECSQVQPKLWVRYGVYCFILSFWPGEECLIEKPQ